MPNTETERREAAFNLGLPVSRKPSNIIDTPTERREAAGTYVLAPSPPTNLHQVVA